MNGSVVSEVLLGQRTFDLLVRLDEPFREDSNSCGDWRSNLPGGGHDAAGDAVADIYEASGPNTINRENVRRRIVVQCNTCRPRPGRASSATFKSGSRRSKRRLPTGYFIEYGGQFESQQSATRMIGLLSLVSLAGMFLVLYTMFRSVNLSLQVMAALPMAASARWRRSCITGQIADRGQHGGFHFAGGHRLAQRHPADRPLPAPGALRRRKLHAEMIERAGKERLAPMLMTALTAGIALVPLVLAAGEPGKEILYPVATVILGGLISSTLLDFFVHPALFWCFGRKDAEEQLAAGSHDDLDDEFSQRIEEVDAHVPFERHSVPPVARQRRLSWIYDAFQFTSRERDFFYECSKRNAVARWYGLNSHRARRMQHEDGPGSRDQARCNITKGTATNTRPRNIRISGRMAGISSSWARKPITPNCSTMRRPIR